MCTIFFLNKNNLSIRFFFSCLSSLASLLSSSQLWNTFHNFLLLRKARAEASHWVGARLGSSLFLLLLLRGVSAVSLSLLDAAFARVLCHSSCAAVARMSLLLGGCASRHTANPPAAGSFAFRDDAPGSVHSTYVSESDRALRL